MYLKKNLKMFSKKNVRAHERMCNDIFILYSAQDLNHFIYYFYPIFIYLTLNFQFFDLFLLCYFYYYSLFSISNFDTYLFFYLFFYEFVYL